MINITQGGHYWEELDQPSHASSVEVNQQENWRFSPVLGPTGEPLRVNVPRPILGFDLRNRQQRIRS